MRPIDHKSWIVMAAAAAAAAGIGGAAVSDVQSQPRTGEPLRPNSVRRLATSAMLMAKTCVPAYSQTGHGKLQAGAEISARNNWNKLRPDGFSRFNDSPGHDMTCHHDGRPPLRRQWTCVATAQPCKEEEGGTGSSTGTGTGTGTGTPICHAAFSVEGVDAKLQTQARNFAVDAWQGVAASKHGVLYQTWGLAQGTDISCRHNNLGPLQRRWRCIATASPCRHSGS